MSVRYITRADAGHAAALLRHVENAVIAEFKEPKALNPLRGNLTFRARVRDCCILLQVETPPEGWAP